MSIGVFDSGLGGLTVYNAIAAILPHIPIVYYGDNARSPYGVRTHEDIYRFTLSAVHCLWGIGCDLVILACNTASAVALRRIQENDVPADKRVLGVFVPLIEALTERHWGDRSPPSVVRVQQVALFATPATVASRAFQRELSHRALGVDVESEPCAGIVDAIEAQDMPLAQDLVKIYVKALKRRMPRPNAAILGCTHYPLLFDTFAAALGTHVKLFDQPNIVASSLDNYLQRHPNMLGQGQQSLFLTTGDKTTVSNSAQHFLGRKVDFEHVAIDNA